MLFPTESINEKFLIRLRDCVLKLNDRHPLKGWMKSLNRIDKFNNKYTKTREFLQEVLNTQYNLITDPKVRKNIVDILIDMPEESIPEKLIKAYLYLIIGNVTRSDNILKKIVNEPPFVNWIKNEDVTTPFHKISIENMEQILLKFAKHPTDRKVFQLFLLYLKNFYNENSLREIISSYDTSEIESKINLKITETLAPSFIYYLRILKLTEAERIIELRKNHKKFSDQSYWIWPFIDIGPLVSDDIYPELERIEKSDELWFIYLMDDERMFDLFTKKKGRSFLPGRRSYLKRELNDQGKFMMSLYKLIEFGDINSDLVNKLAEYHLND